MDSSPESRESRRCVPTSLLQSTSEALAEVVHLQVQGQILELQQAGEARGQSSCACIASAEIVLVGGGSTAGIGSTNSDVLWFDGIPS